MLGCLHTLGSYEGALQEAHSALTAGHFARSLRKGREGLGMYLGHRDSYSPTACKAGPQNDLLLQDTSWEGHHNNPEFCHVDPIFQLSDFSHLINNKPQCYCHHLHHQPCNSAQVRQGEANEEGFNFLCSNNESKEKLDIITHLCSYTLHKYLFHCKMQFILHKCISSIAFI